MAIKSKIWPVFVHAEAADMKKTLKKIAKITGKTPIATMHLTKNEIENPEENINNFENKINNR